jgi:hypothetical protein
MHETLPADQQTAYESVPDQARVGRFSLGLETRPGTAEKLHRGRFSDGVERVPQRITRRNGRFSAGLEARPEIAENVRRGSFADRADAPVASAG